MKKVISMLLVAVMLLSSFVFIAVAASSTPLTYDNCKDTSGNLLTTHLVDNKQWTYESGELYLADGEGQGYLLFDDKLDKNRVEAEIVINDTKYGNENGGDGNKRYGIVFALTDYENDLSFTTSADRKDEASYYWAFINDWNCVEVIEMGKHSHWGWLSTSGVDLSAKGIDVKEGVRLAVEWDNAGHIKVYANDILIHDITDPTPLTGNMYGLLVNKHWNHAADPTVADAYFRSFTAGSKPLSFPNCTDADGDTLRGHAANDKEWTLNTNGELRLDLNSTQGFLLFDNKLEANNSGNYRVETTLKTSDNKKQGTEYENIKEGIIFGYSDKDNDWKFDETNLVASDADASFYWVAITAYNTIAVYKLGPNMKIEHIGEGEAIGIDKIPGLTVNYNEEINLAVEWEYDDNGDLLIDVYVNNVPVYKNIKDTEPLTGRYYGLGVNRGQANIDETYFTSFVAGGDTPLIFSNISATIGLPENIEDIDGITFNGTISVSEWDNSAKYKMITMIVDVPSNLTVTKVSAGSRISGGEIRYHLNDGRLRVVYFDPNKNSDLTVSGTSFPAALFNITFKTDKVSAGDVITIKLDEMSFKSSSDSADVDSTANIVIENAIGSVRVVKERTFSAGVLYKGDGVEMIPSNKQAILVTATRLSGTKKLTYNDGTNTVEFKYSAEISSKMGVPAYVAIVSTSIPLASFENAEYFTIGDASAENVIFGDINGDKVVNAQDALAAVDMWLRKTEKPDDDTILATNVNADGRIDAYDALGIVEAFVYNDNEYAIITKATTVLD